MAAVSSRLRMILLTSAGLNVLGTVAFLPLAFGRLSPLLPLDASPYLAGQLAFVIALFGGVYAWLATQDRPTRPLLLVGAIGKLGFFLLSALYAAFGELSWQMAAAASPDLLLGGALLWAVSAEPCREPL